jgi:16S rRNA (guanine527-N7)-methyltransferase
MSKTAPAIPSEDVIHRTLAEFRVQISAEQALKIQTYMRMLLVWNEKINLTAIRDPQEIVSRHFGESMLAASTVPLGKGRLADVGSGGGFPGLPIKIICPELQVFLVESNVKKATFLAEAVRELHLSETSVLVGRYEELGEELAPLDFVCTRALGEFGSFLGWAGSPQIAASQAILWVGGRDLNEVKTISGWEWQEPVPIPRSLQRFLLVGSRELTLIRAQPHKVPPVSPNRR